MSLEKRLRRLEDRAELEELVSAYCQGANGRDLALFESVWQEDAIWDVGTHVFRGHEEIIPAVKRQWEAFQSMHHWTTNSRYNINGDRAAAEHDVAALTIRADGSGVLSAGRYIDDFERRSGIWRLAKRAATIVATVPLPNSQ